MAVVFAPRFAGRGAARALLARAALALALASCTTGEAVIRPVIDVPVDDIDATATPLDEIILRIAHAGNPHDIATQTFRRGEPLEMAAVPFGDDLVLHMEGYVGAGRPVAYGRTCAFSVQQGVGDAAPHLYFSRNVKFGTLGIAPKPRFGGLGISYLGTAMLIGGNEGSLGTSSLITQVERFDPLTGALTTPLSVVQRDSAVQAQVGTLSPQVVVLGGTMGTDGAKIIEVLDADSYSRVDFSDMARVGLTATSLSDGNIVVIGGRTPGAAPVGDISLITQTNSMLVIQPLPKLAHARSGHTATRLGEDASAPVLIAGGVDAQGPVAEAELFKPLAQALAMNFTQSMAIARSGHVATLMPDGSVLIIGGLDGNGAPIASIERFSIDGGFSEAAALRNEAGDETGLVDFATTVLPGGRILLTGGRAAPDGRPLDTAHIIQLNPLGGTVEVVPTDRLAFARAGHQAVALCDGTVLITGGTGGEVPAERYNPPPDDRR
jgi:hypothetical protein